MSLRSRFLALLATTLLLSVMGLAQGKKSTNSSKAAATGQSFTGEISDSMCGKKHMMGGSSGTECTRACVKDGSSYALVVGDKVYTLKGGDKTALDKMAGQRATIKGKLSGETIEVASISPATK